MCCEVRLRFTAFKILRQLRFVETQNLQLAPALIVFEPLKAFSAFVRILVP
jgi:hypothetical protein